MFGYILANPKLMTEEEFHRYRAAYCGLCRTLGRRHGQLARLSLTYDMTFLLLFLGALYEPEETTEAFRCPIHPKQRRQAVYTRFTDYAADMNVLLAYLNCRDDWEDDRKLSALVESAVFRSAYEQAEECYPRQAETVEQSLRRLSEIEQAEDPGLDTGANCFGDLLGELFVYDPADYWAPHLRRFGRGLGKFIYFYDACMDYEKDLRRGSYNPLKGNIPDGLSVEPAREMLRILISDCTKIYEGLPIVQDDGIIKNILYSGVWMRMDAKYGSQDDGSAAK